MTYDKLKNIITGLGYTFYEGEMNINMIGVRTNNTLSDYFDDVFYLAYQHNGENVLKEYLNFTTDPGLYYLQNKLLNPHGCAILKPGQYKGMWKIGMHGYKNPYEAFVQAKQCVVYRDRNKDNHTDFLEESIDVGIFGINQHHGYSSKNVGANSAGCQVHKTKEQLNEVLTIAKESLKYYQNSFTYTLINEKDII